MLTNKRKKELDNEINKYDNIDGICSSCKEHTSVLFPCCGVNVYSEGHSYNFESIIDEIVTDENEREYAFNYIEKEL